MTFASATPRMAFPFSLCLALVLQGCSDKPPGCTDPQTLALAKQVVIDGALIDDGSTFEYSGMFRGRIAAAPAEVLGRFTDSLQVTVSDITSQGYDSSARMESCAGTLEVSGATMRLSAPIRYTTQLAAGDSRRQVLRTSDLTPVIRKVQMAAIEHLNAHEAALRQASAASSEVAAPSSNSRPQANQESAASSIPSATGVESR